MKTIFTKQNLAQVFGIALLLLISLNTGTVSGQSCTPSTTAVACDVTTTFNLGASGYAGDNPTGGDGGCNPCCYAGADLDCDGLQDVPFSVENARFYRYCNSTGSSQVVSVTADEPGTGGTCNLQGAIWTGTALNGTTMDCGNPNYSNFDSNSGGAADGFTFGSVTVANGECAYIMVDGYAGTTCTGVGLTVDCPCVPPVASATPTSQTFCSGGTTSISLSSTLAGTTYTWTVNQSGVTGASSGSGSTISQTLTATGTTAGTATYTITPTAGGCVGTPITVTVTVNPRPVMTSPSTATVCSGGTLNIPLTSNVASTYVWSAASNTNVTGESTTNQNTNTINNTLTNSTTSVQTVTYTVTPTSSTGSCLGTAQTVTVTVNPTPTMTSATTATICSGGTVSIPLTSNVASTYSWIATANGNVTGESTTAQSGSPLSNTLTNTTTSAQNVVYTVTPTSSAGSCPGTPQTVTVTVNPAPTMTSAATATICSGGTVSIPLTANMASTFVWVATANGNVTGESTTNQTTNTLSNTLTNSTTSVQTVTYTVTPTSNPGGCAGPAQTVTVTVNPVPTMTSASTATICSGGTVSIPLTSNVASTYSWVATANGNVSGESTTAQSGSPLSNTLTNTTTSAQNVIYTVTPTSTAGSCPGTPQTVTVTVNPLPTMTSATTASICSGGTVSIPLTSDVASTYSWVAAANGNVTGESTTAQSGSPLSNTLTNTTTSSQSVVYTVTPTSTAGSCVGSPQTVTVTVNPAPTMTSANTATICSGATLNIALTSNIAATYSWVAAANGNVTGETTTATSSSTINNTLTNTTTSAENVVYTVTPTSTVGSCPGTPQTVTVTVNPVPAMTNANTATICSGGTVSIALTSNVASTYSWVATANGNVTGESTVAQSGSPLSNTLTNTTTTAQNVLYTVTPTSTVGSCPGTPQTVTVTVNPAPTMTSASTATICSGATVSINLTSDIPSTYSWIATANSNVTGESTTAQAGSPLSNTLTNATTSAQNVVYTVTPTSTAGSCVGTPQTVTVTVNPLDNASFSYSPSTFCTSGANPSPTITGLAGGTFSSTAGLVFVSTATGQINLSASTIGSYVVTYTTNGTCPNSSTFTVTITNAPVATFSYTGTPYCQTGADPSPTFSGGGSAGTFTSTAGLVFVNSSTGQIDLSASTPGTYTVTNTIAASGGCPAMSANSNVTINAPAVATFSYTGTPYCQNAANPSPSFSGGGVAGTFSSTAGLVINAATGVVNLASSTAGTYIVTNTIAASGGCPAITATASITITPLPVATFSYTGTPYCQTASNPNPTFSGGGVAGTFSSTAGLVFVSTATGQVNLAASTPGTYTVTNTIPAANGCPAVTATSGIVITAPPVATFSYTGTPYCQNGSNPSPTFSGGGVAGTFSSTAGLNINAGTGVVNLSASTPGTYTVTNTIAAAGGCPAVTATSSITITPLPVATFSYTATPYCQTAADPSPTFSGGGVAGTFSSTAGLTFISTSTGEVDLSASTPGTYTVTNTIAAANGCPAVTATSSITITAPQTAAFSYTGTPYCQNGVDPSPVFSGGGVAGTFTSTAGLSINAGTGTVDLSASTAGTYTVTNTIAATGGCPAVIETATITITPLPVATFSFTGSPYCQTSANPSPTFSGGGSAGTFSSTAGLVFVSTATGQVDLAASTTGTYTVTNTIGAANGCPAVTATSTITITAPAVATFNYAASPYCQNSANPSPVFTGGGIAGTFSSTAGLSINAATGAVNLAASTAGTYTVTNTIAANGGCPAVTASSTITITALPVATFSFTGSPYCQSAANPSPAFSGGGSAGTFTSTAGLSINAATGVVNLAASTPGSYTVTNSFPAANGCPAVSATATITITEPQTADFSYPGSPYCQGAANPSPLFAGDSGPGTFSSTAGLVFVNTSTGFIDLAASTPGTYTVTNSIAANGGCPAVSATATIVINSQDDATFSYSPSTLCESGSNPSAIITGTSGGTFSSTAGLNFVNTATGEINLATSSVGTYTVTYTTSGPCSDVSTFSVTITNSPGASFSYAGPYCATGTDPSPTFTPGSSAGIFSSTAGLVFVNIGTGEIDLSASTPGTYTVTNTIAASGGCPAVTATNSVTITSPQTGAFSYTSTPYCQNGADPLPAFSGGGIAGTFSSSAGLQINASTGEVDLSASTAGTYTVTNTIAANNGCAAVVETASITITALPVGTFSYTSSPYCQNGTDPNPTFSGGGQAGTFSSTAGLVFVNTSTGEVDLSASTAGTYTVTNTIAAAAGCPAVVETSSITITPLPVATFNYNGSPYCQDATDPLPVFTGSGVAGTFSSSAGLVFINTSTGEIDLSASTPGSYTVSNTIAAANGCPAVTETFNIVINANDDPTFAYTASTYCMSGSNPTATVTGTAGGTFTSVPSTGITINSSTGEIDLTASAAGTYTVTYTTNGACPDNASMTVTLTNAPDATFSYNGPYCTSTTGPVSPVFSAGASAGSLTSTAGLSLNALTGEIDPSASTPGTYTVTNTINIAGCATATDTALVVINPVPTVTTITSADSICSGSVYTVTMNGPIPGTSFNYTSVSSAGTITGNTNGTGNISETLTNTGLSSGPVTYTITPTANGCTGTAVTAVITVQPIPTIVATPTTDTICSGASTNLGLSSSLSNASFDWTVVSSSTLTGAANGTGNTIAQTLTNSGTDRDTAVYTLTASLYGCSSTTTAMVFVDPTPVASASPASSTICSGTAPSVVLSSTVTGSSYNWTQVSGISITGASNGSGSSFSNPVLTNSGSAIDSVVYTFTVSANGCPGNTVNATVLVTPSPTATPSAATQTICSGSSTNITLTPTPASANITWTASASSANVTGFSNGSGSAISQALTNSGSTSETVSYTVTADANGCVGTSTIVTVTVDPTPGFTASPAAPSICSGANTNITLSSNVSGASFNWTATSPATVTGASADAGSMISQTLSSTSSTTETMTYTITVIANGCSSTAALPVNVTPVPAGPVVTGSATYCSGAAVNVLTATGSTGSTITWYDNASLTTAVGTGSTLTPSNTATTTYYAVQTITGCTSSASTGTVTIQSVPDASCTASTLTGMAPLQVSFTNNSLGANSYAWDLGNSTTSIEENTSTTYATQGTYEVTLVASNGLCVDSFSLSIVVEGKSLVIVPNVFTPNGDNSNDIFMVTNENLEVYNLQIFDRWGLRMFHTEDHKGGWDGRTEAGKDATDGTYFYVIKATGRDGVNYDMTGHLLLKR